MLCARDAEQEQWLAAAEEATLRQFGNEVFVRAVVEVSNYCRENCTYCGMRRENRTLSRFRAEADQLAELLLEHRPGSVTDINIQAGEDPVAVRRVVLPLLRTLKAETNLGLSVCVGTLTHDLYQELQEAGASIYIMKFEIGSESEYARFQAPGNQAERLRHIRLLAEDGWRVSSGFIAGLPGQDVESLLANLRLASELPLSGCSVSPFIPGDETPLGTAPIADIESVINCMVALRLMRPDWVIPSVSALNLAEPGMGYRRGLRAGANLVTINMTPDGLRDDYLLYKRDRFIMSEERILSAIAVENRVPSPRGLAAYYREQDALVRAAGSVVAEA
ncbi:MAG TPA: radical SAM protein [Verrucomicrobiales bacterium]|nr:radical SAM protein [Verrucomicrobiales bacterium]